MHAAAVVWVCVVLVILFLIVFIPVYDARRKKKTKKDKILVLYVFHQYNDRVRYFINHAVFKDPDVDFVLISNNPDTQIRLPSYVRLIKRENIGYDFGGWSDALEQEGGGLDRYKYVIFANSSIIGPYIRKKKEWPYILTDGLKDDVKLFGVTINTLGHPDIFSHVQSYLFALDVETVKMLMNEHILCTCHHAETFQDAITHKEIGMSRKILEHGGNISATSTYYHGIDFRKPYPSHSPEILWDIMFNGYEQNNTWTRGELVFIKGNRDIEWNTS